LTNGIAGNVLAV